MLSFFSSQKIKATAQEKQQNAKSLVHGSFWRLGNSDVWGAEVGRDRRETAAWTRAEREASAANSQKRLLETSLMEKREGDESWRHFLCDVKEQGTDLTPSCAHKLPPLTEGAMLLSSYMGTREGLEWICLMSMRAVIESRWPLTLAVRIKLPGPQGLPSLMLPELWDCQGPAVCQRLEDNVSWRLKSRKTCWEGFVLGPWTLAWCNYPIQKIKHTDTHTPTHKHTPTHTPHRNNQTPYWL